MAALPAAVVLAPVLLPAAGASSSTGGAGRRFELALRSAVRLVGRLVLVPSWLISFSCCPREEGAVLYCSVAVSLAPAAARLWVCWRWREESQIGLCRQQVQPVSLQGIQQCKRSSMAL